MPCTSVSPRPPVGFSGAAVCAAAVSGRGGWLADAPANPLRARHSTIMVRRMVIFLMWRPGLQTRAIHNNAFDRGAHHERVTLPDR